MWELDCEESWVLKNWCFWTVELEKTLESPLDCKEIQPVPSEGDQPWDFFGRNDAKAETPILWPPHVKSWLIGKDWCWEGLGTGGEGDDRGWDGLMASLTWWTWVWVNSRSWWWTGRPGVLQFMGSQRVGHNWATELNWTESFSSWSLRDFALFKCILICLTTNITTNCCSCQKHLNRFCYCYLSNKEQFAIFPNSQWSRNDIAGTVVSTEY